MKKEFTVLGEPVGKGRPRFSVNRGSGYVQVHTPDKTVAYETLVRLEYHAQCGGEPFKEKEMIRLEIKAYFGIPKRASKKVRQDMIDTVQRPVKKPDMDNIVKAIADALNNVAYHDDSQIVSARIDKYYSEQPRVEVKIESI